LPWYGEIADEADDEHAAYQSFHSRSSCATRTPFGTQFIRKTSQPDGANTMRLMRRDESPRRLSRYVRPAGRAYRSVSGRSSDTMASAGSSAEASIDFRVVDADRLCGDGAPADLRFPLPESSSSVGMAHRPIANRARP
jgi:hypothetical protein